MPRDGRGKYNLAECALWYIRFLQDYINKREGMGAIESGDTLKTERQRLISAQADREILELKKMKGELVPLSLFEEIMSKQITDTRQKFLVLPANIAPELEGESRAI